MSQEKTTSLGNVLICCTCIDMNSVVEFSHFDIRTFGIFYRTKVRTFVVLDISMIKLYLHFSIVTYNDKFALIIGPASVHNRDNTHLTTIVEGDIVDVEHVRPPRFIAVHGRVGGGPAGTIASVLEQCGPYTHNQHVRCCQSESVKIPFFIFFGMSKSDVNYKWLT